MFSPNLGIFYFTFEQLEKIRISRDSIANFFGRFLRFLQPFRLRRVSLLRKLIDVRILHKFVQSSRSNFSRIGTSLKSGVSISSRNFFNKMNFNLPKDCKSKEKKKLKTISFYKVLQFNET